MRGAGLLSGSGLGAWAVFVAFGGRVSRDPPAVICWDAWGFVVSWGTLGVGAGEVVAEGEGVGGGEVDSGPVNVSGAVVGDLAR